jgi:2-keto-4-pentenoate hydratase/2-oxohepta-3-ene-1,7-dioic acid hydratase in catechol pathway
MKPDSSVLSKNMPFVIPSFSNDVHYEVEVLVKICKVGKHISQKFAPNYYNEIGLGIDFTARDLQKQLKDKGLPWEKAKAFDGSALIGDFINKNEIKNVNDLSFSLHKNNELVQEGNTNAMLWKIDELISYVSQFFTLKIGDVIFTGTPAGVEKVEEKDTLKGILEGKEIFTVNVR